MKKRDIMKEYLKKVEAQLVLLEAADVANIEHRLQSSERAIIDLEWVVRELLATED